MPVYAHLCKGTTQGFQDIKGLPQRWEKAKTAIKEGGGKLLGAYALLGRYDYLILVEWPDTASCLSLSLQVASRGTVSIETLEAIPIGDFLKIAKKV